MIYYSIAGVKNALKSLVDTADAAIFTDAADIITGYPEKHLIRQDSPTDNKPLVAIYIKSPELKRIGYRDFAFRERRVVPAAPVDEWYLDDYYRTTEIVMPCEINILATTPDELLGSTTWVGYIEQIAAIVESNTHLIGRYFSECDDTITWDLKGFDHPLELTFMEKQIQLGIIQTVLTGNLFAVETSAEVTQAQPLDGDFI